MQNRKRMGEILVEAGVIDRETLEKALERQKGDEKCLGKILEEMGVVSQDNIAAAIARQFGFKTVRNLAERSYPDAVLKSLTGDRAMAACSFPLKIEGKTLYLAMANPLDLETIDKLTFSTGLRIVPCVTTPREIQDAINKHYLTTQSVAARQQWVVLVVEDQEMIRTSVARALQKDGYRALEAINGLEGLKLVHTNQPHLVITDTVMPQMDGYQLFRALQSTDKTKKIPVIALSSRSSAEEEAKLLDMGYFDFVPKPINPVRLAARVKRALKTTYGDLAPP